MDSSTPVSVQVLTCEPGEKFGNWTVVQKIDGHRHKRVVVCKCGEKRLMHCRKKIPVCYRCSQARPGVNDGNTVRTARLASSLRGADCARAMNVSKQRWFQLENEMVVADWQFRRMMKAIEELRIFKSLKTDNRKESIP
jgi:hypothetical protein